MTSRLRMSKMFLAFLTQINLSYCSRFRDHYFCSFQIWLLKNVHTHTPLAMTGSRMCKLNSVVISVLCPDWVTSSHCKAALILWHLLRYFIEPSVSVPSSDAFNYSSCFYFVILLHTNNVLINLASDFYFWLTEVDFLWCSRICFRVNIWVTCQF